MSSIINEKNQRVAIIIIKLMTVVVIHLVAYKVYFNIDGISGGCITCYYMLKRGGWTNKQFPRPDCGNNIIYICWMIVSVINDIVMSI